jgi:outer membrane receptor protein involved in Fe transport
VPAATLAMDVVAVSGIGTVGNEDGFIADPGDDDAAAVDAHVAGYAVVSLRGTYAIDRHFTVYGGVTNLFDTHYDNFGALATDLLPGGAIVAPQVAPGEAPVARFVAPGAPRAWYLGLRYSY